MKMNGGGRMGEDLSVTASVASKITPWAFPINCVCPISATRLKIT